MRGFGPRVIVFVGSPFKSFLHFELTTPASLYIHSPDLAMLRTPFCGTLLYCFLQKIQDASSPCWEGAEDSRNYIGEEGLNVQELSGCSARAGHY